MKLLLDTHVLLWWLQDDPRLRPRVRAIIADLGNEVLVSTGSLWEISIKHRKGKLVEAGSAVWRDAAEEGFRLLSIEREHLEALEALVQPDRHGDPFDHLILAQASVEQAVVVTADRHMTSYGIPYIGVA